MLMKKTIATAKCFSLILLLLLTSLCFTGCAKDDAAKYADAQTFLTAGKLDEAISAFSDIENYNDSSKYIMYIKAMKIAEEGQYDNAINSFASLEDFKDSKLLATYYNARKLEALKSYSESSEFYKTIITFKDSTSRYATTHDANLTSEISNAETLLIENDQDKAYDLFVTLVDQKYSDSPTRIFESIYATADKSLADGKYDFAWKLFKLLGERHYIDSKTREKDSISACISNLMEKYSLSDYQGLIDKLSILSDRPIVVEIMKECHERLALSDSDSKTPEPTSTPTPTPIYNYRKASKEQIEELQWRLIDLRWLNDAWPNGKYDKATEDAIKDFQNYVNRTYNAHLEVDGTAAASTIDWLMDEDAPIKPDNEP